MTKFRIVPEGERYRLSTIQHVAMFGDYQYDLGLFETKEAARAAAQAYVAKLRRRALETEEFTI